MRLIMKEHRCKRCYRALFSLRIILLGNIGDKKPLCKRSLKKTTCWLIIFCLYAMKL
jgi:hypothetical protein